MDAGTQSGTDAGTLPGGGDGGQPGVTPDAGVSEPGRSLPELTLVQAQVSGRIGRDLRLSIKGKDRDLNIVGLWVRLLDAAGAPVLGFDTDRDGTGDASEAPVALEDPKLVGEALTATATLRGVFDKGRQVPRVAVSLDDATGLRSGEQTVSVVAQPVRSIGEPCDPQFLTSRCAQGLGCRGTSPTCQEGVAPVIGRLAFLKAANGPTILIEGTEPEDDLSLVRLEFQNAQGQLISVDTDADGIPDLERYDIDANGAAVDGAFFIRMQSGQGFDEVVPKLVATPSDLAGHQGVAKVVAPSVAPVRSAGQTCDARGFDVCGLSLACSPGVVGQTNKCEQAQSLRDRQCTAAPVLVATAAGATAIGFAEGVSVWDAPTGCSSADPKGRPEGIVTLRLTQRASHLTLSTVGSGTNFDTTLYMLTGCTGDVSSNFGCAEDAPGGRGASTLVVDDVPAGDYLVVVDSFDPEGGRFALTAKVE